MKKVKLFILILIAGLTVSFAQESVVKSAAAKAFWDRVHIGVKGGLTATNVNIDVRDTDLDDYDIPTAEKMNWRVGVDTKIDLFDAFFFKTGLEYINKGFNVDLDGFKKKFNDIKDIKGNWSVIYRYLEMPIHFGYDLGGFELIAGPYLSYALGGVENIDVEGTLSDNTTFDFSDNTDLQPVSGGSVNQDLPDDITGFVPDYFKSFDFGLTLGLGFKLDKFNIQVQYEQGFNNITPDFSQEPNFNPDDLQLKHNVLSVNVTYWIK